jgi:hypothetical protein
MNAVIIRETGSMRAFSAALSLAFMLVASAALASPVGTYDVSGTNPGGKTTYSGSVSVEKTGATYRVVWVVAGQRFVGTGIGDKNFLAVSYRSGDQTGLALYAEEGEGTWTGVWTYAGGSQIGTERWERR